MPETSTSHGWKIGEIGLDRGRIRLRSGVYGIYLDRVEHAICFQNVEHEAPVASCTCGFGAVSSPESLILHARPPYSQLFEVVLSGRVLTERSGLRGEIQTVSRVHLNPHCFRCQHRAAVLCADPSRDPNAPTPRLADALIPACAQCATSEQWNLELLSELIDVEVVWADPEYALVLLGLSYNH